MTRLFSFLAAIAALFANAAAQEKVAPDLYGSLPTVSAAEISPDGNTIAQIQSDATGKAVAFYDLTGKKKPIGVRIGDADVRSLQWAGPDHAIALVSGSRTFAWGHGLESHEFFRWISINRETGEFTYMFEGPARFNWTTYPGQLYSILPDEPDKILMSHASRQWEFSLYRVDLNTGKAVLATRDDTHSRWGASQYTIDWVIDATGRPAVRIDYDSRKEERRFYKPADNHKGWTLASTIPEKESDDEKIVLKGLADAPTLFHGLVYKNGFRGLYVYDIDTGEIVRSEVASENYDINHTKTDPRSAAVVAAYYVDDFPRTKFIASPFKEIQAKLEKALPNATPVITSWSDDLSKIMAQVHYSDHPEQYFLYDRNKKTLSMVAASYAALDGKIQAKKEKYDYVASDGLKIPGYLTAPAGAIKQNLPLIVLPHGGPWARDDQSFDWWSFFYAARGYLVYQPNFRGSDGYGVAYRDAGNGEWGRKMQDDITEGVRKLIEDGVVDPDRICIVGASYGGYAALAGATLTPDLYACAVSVGGVSNVLQLLSDRDNDYWEKRVGSRFTDEKSLRAVSPLYNLSSQTPPIMLIHGEHDVVVPVGQSRVMRREMRDRGYPHEYVELDGEDHWLSTGEMRTEMLRRSIDFIDRYIGDAAN